MSLSRGQTLADLDGLDLIGVDPLPSWIWYQDMADFAETIADKRTRTQAGPGHPGQGSLPQFKDELREEYPDLLA